MNWDIVEGNWTQYQGKVREQWRELTDEHLHMIAGKRTELAGKLQETYGMSRQDAEAQICHFERHHQAGDPARAP